MSEQPSALFVTTVASTLRAFLLPLASDLRSRGWRVDALAAGATSEPELGGAFDALLDATWTRNPLHRGNVFGMVKRVREIVSQGGYSVVHVHTPIASFVTRYALRGMRAHGGPVVIYTAHGFHFYRGQSRLRYAAYRRLERMAARWTDFLVTLNVEDYEAARAFPAIDPGHVRLIPGVGVDIATYESNAVSAEDLARIREELDLDRSSVVLTCIAEFGQVKRHAHLLEAMALVKDEHVVLVLVGAGPLEADLKQRARELGLRKRVRWAGYRTDIATVIAASDAVILTSEREGLPRSLMEGMAAGKPVIGTDTRGIADLGGDGAGWIVAKDDTAALAAAIDEAAARPDERAARGAVARRKVEDVYALPHILEAYRELYDEALASRV